MAGQFGDSQAPEAGVVTDEQRVEGNATPAERAANETLVNTDINPPEDGWLAYVAADKHANSRFLVKAGEVTKAPPAAGSTSGIIPLVNRMGDIWAVFTAGILVSNEPLVIAWCEENPTICRLSSDPMTKPWATLKALESAKSNREQLVPADEINADAAFPPHSVNTPLAAQAAREGSAGSEQVRHAEISRESAAKAASGS